jgi:hypothetical protein
VGSENEDVGEITSKESGRKGENTASPIILLPSVRSNMDRAAKHRSSNGPNIGQSLDPRTEVISPHIDVDNFLLL